jgi:hypothetical protein
MKRLMIGVAVMMLLSGIAGAMTTDSVLLLVTPVYNLSINIVADSTNFGFMDIGSSKSINVGKIWNDGNVTARWDKQSSNASDGTGATWSLTTVSPARNQFSLLAIATGTATGPAIETQYGGGASNLNILALGTSQTQCYVTNSFTELTEGLSGKGFTYGILKTMNLWVSLMMPPDISVGLSQNTITLSIRAATP